MIIGSHVSMKAPNYLVGSIQEALSYDANACMIYTGPPSNSKRVDIEKLKVDEAKELMKEKGILVENIVVHAPYIINLANSARPETAQFGVEFLVEELKRVQKIGAKYCVLHPGSHVKMGSDVGLEWIVKGIDEVFSQVDNDIFITLETMAGKGSECGCTFEEIAYIIQNVKQNHRLKVCLDTCHIHDAGYDVSNFDAVLDEFDRIIGLDRLAVIHVNDSKNPRGAHKDRHENIGKGYIGFEALYNVVHHPKLVNIVKILETPYIDDKPPYKEEIELLRK